MYTSQSIGKLTLILASQVRTDLSNMMFAKDKNTGGNAIAHYNLVTVEMKRLGDANWPNGKDNMPPNSFVTQLTLKKAKIMNRHTGNKINMYFYKGGFDHKFNVVAIAKDLGIHDGKKLVYKVQAPTLDEVFGGDNNGMIEKEFKVRGFNEFFDKVPDEAVTWMEKQIPIAYQKMISCDPSDEEENNIENNQ